MRTSSVLLSLSTLAVLSAAGGAWAQAQPAALPEIAVLAALPRYPIKLREARAIRGVYDMSNGWTIEVRPDWRRVFVEINGRKPLEVIPISADKFVSRDANMALEFNRGNGGDEMVLRYAPGGVAAQAVVATSRLARR
jgi:hypothetical protein